MMSRSVNPTTVSTQDFSVGAGEISGRACAVAVPRSKRTWYLVLKRCQPISIATAGVAMSSRPDDRGALRITRTNYETLQLAHFDST